MSSGARVLSPAEAADTVRTVDSLAVPLGPGVPGQFLHALANREDFTRLDIFGALLPDLYEVFVRPGVFYRSGFCGPAERFLVASGADVEFVPSDFRGFEPALEAIAPRIVSTAGTPPEADGLMSLSLHAGASVAELQRACADPDRICLVETGPGFPRPSDCPLNTFTRPTSETSTSSLKATQHHSRSKTPTERTRDNHCAVCGVVHPRWSDAADRHRWHSERDRRDPR